MKCEIITRYRLLYLKIIIFYFFVVLVNSEKRNILIKIYSYCFLFFASNTNILVEKKKDKEGV